MTTVKNFLNQENTNQVYSSQFVSSQSFLAIHSHKINVWKDKVPSKSIIFQSFRSVSAGLIEMGFTRFEWIIKIYHISSLCNSGIYLHVSNTDKTNRFLR